MQLTGAGPRPPDVVCVCPASPCTVRVWCVLPLLYCYFCTTSEHGMRGPRGPLPTSACVSDATEPSAPTPPLSAPAPVRAASSTQCWALKNRFVFLELSVFQECLEPFLSQKQARSQLSISCDVENLQRAENNVGLGALSGGGGQWPTARCLSEAGAEAHPHPSHGARGAETGRVSLPLDALRRGAAC